MNVVVVQARMGSSRLPGKVLADLAGRPVLHHVLARCAAIPGVDRVCCAVPDLPTDDMLVPVAEAAGAVVVRGPERNVLERYVLAARACEATTVARVTADCPILDPDVGGAVLDAFLSQGADYASNTDPRSWPKGLDFDVFTRDALERAYAEARDHYDREHVTPYIRTGEGFSRINVALLTDECADWRWTLDYPEDLAFFRALFAALDMDPLAARFPDFRRIVEARPDIAAINAGLV